MLLLAAGGGSVVIDGLGFSLSGVTGTAARLTCVALGALALCAAFVVHFGARAIEAKVLVGGVLAVAGLLGALVLTVHPKLPDITGLTEGNAEKILAQLDIEVRASRAAVSDEPNGQVIDQVPEPGSRSSSVTLVVSQGPPIPRLPNVVDFEVALARRQLNDLGIGHEVKTVPGQPAGRVVAMVPEAGEQARAVVLTVADGLPLPTMVRVAGLTESAAIAKLTRAQIEVDTVRVESSEPVGQVLAQDPDAGISTSRAVVTISAGPGLPVVPDLVNLASSEAQSVLDTAGIASTITDERSDVVPAGVVIGQKPDAGERSRSVQVVVSSGPAPASFAGDWRNVDTATRGVTRLVIGRDGATMRGFGSCTPTDCDWGTVTASPTANALVAHQDFGFKTIVISAEIAGPLLLVEVQTNYVDGRTDRTDVFTMSKTPIDDLTADDFDVLRSTELLSEAVATGAAEFVPQIIESPQLYMREN